MNVRAWVDGPPNDAMLKERADSLRRLTPESDGRWGDGTGRVELARACFESGWDAAVIASRSGGMSKKSEAAQAMGRDFVIPPNSVMVDIETTGQDTQRHTIIQIGACVFNDKFEITSEFRRSLTPPPDRTDDQETLDWWKQTNLPLYEKIRAAAEPFDVVLRDLCKWLPRSRGMLWGWPANFDLMFIFQYGRTYHRGLLHWFHPSRFIDCRSWALGARGSWVTSEQQEAIFHQPSPYGGVLHDGLDDAKWQVACLQRLAAEVSRRRSADEAERFALFQPPPGEKPEPQPIGKCSGCGTPVYTDVGFCGVCRAQGGGL